MNMIVSCSRRATCKEYLQVPVGLMPNPTIKDSLIVRAGLTDAATVKDSLTVRIPAQNRHADWAVVKEYLTTEIERIAADREDMEKKLEEGRKDVNMKSNSRWQGVNRL